jgi:alpha-D-ribose 1-methylphosphonate 5-triphosphate diphosphatase
MTPILDGAGGLHRSHHRYRVNAVTHRRSIAGAGAASDSRMTRMEIRNGRALLGNGWVTSPVSIEITDGIGTIATATRQREADWIIDASDLLVLPGIVDLHGDAFERQLEPRPNVRMSLDVALLETDRQLIANGITTAYHGVTWS